MKSSLKKILSLLIIIISYFIYNNVFKEENITKAQNNYGDMVVHFLAVGQGDSTFIELPNKETMLIDAGEEIEKETVKSYIEELGYTKINYLIGTHPHTDHIGGLSYIIENFEVEKIYLPKAKSNTKTYENLLLTIKNTGHSVISAVADKYLFEDDNLEMYFVAPNSNDYTNLNNFSAVLKIDYADVSFLFMGDAETVSENEIETDIKADVIKIGHHGSDSSSGEKFVKKVKAKYGIISVGEDNQYNLPKQEVINRWENYGTEIYRTDISGNIIVKTDGTEIEVEGENK